jgi:dipeptidyl aminopeptidase/acylaminoacyl peptidase
MAEREFARFEARDGLEIPVHVTRPPISSGPAPMIVLVHGGPWARAAGWSWDAESQFLASRGYVVVEPEFRGSHGYGSKLFRAGWKQWGLAMQDDVADAARWAIAKGYADPKRVCIAGASYGGYSTLMGLIRDPALFRCGVQWAGVTDIALQYDQQWSLAEDEVNAWGLPVLIGDREKDAAQFAATSPLQLAAKIRQPVLMAHGEFDRVVPIEQGTRMRNALRHNPNVEWIEYPTEGHGWMLEANNVDFWSRVERFLDRHLMKNPP